mmetsp:Transcript_8457/g.15466  ORF Transcript_8457/g.15466 Transcript_8457/m.15466 type:complete len:223 (-) Transcript_8457:988-1656(-)
MVHMLSRKVPHAKLHIDIVAVAGLVVEGRFSEALATGAVDDPGVDVASVVVPVVLRIPLVNVDPDSPFLLLGNLRVPAFDEALDHGRLSRVGHAHEYHLESVVHGIDGQVADQFVLGRLELGVELSLEVRIGQLGRGRGVEVREAESRRVDAGGGGGHGDLDGVGDEGRRRGRLGQKGLLRCSASVVITCNLVDLAVAVERLVHPYGRKRGLEEALLQGQVG